MDLIMVSSCCCLSYSPPTPLTSSSSYVIPLLVPCVSCLSFLPYIFNFNYPMSSIMVPYRVLSKELYVGAWVPCQWPHHWLKYLYQLRLSAYRSWRADSRVLLPSMKGLQRYSQLLCDQEGRAAVYLTPFILPFFLSLHPVFYSIPRGWEVLRCPLHCSYIPSTLSSTMIPETRERV